jgi:DNA modification methylase
MIDKPTIELHCGDCSEVMARMESKSVDLVFADPPFNVGKKYGKQGDNRADYKQWCGLWIAECFRILKDTGSFYLMTIPRHLEFTMPMMADKGVFVNLITWTHQAGLNDGRRFWALYQPILLYGKTQDYIFNRYAETKPETDNGRWGKHTTEYKGQLGDLWGDIPFVYSGGAAHPEAIRPEGSGKKSHPCQAPEGLSKRAIRFSTKDNAIVFSPFMGSGTDGVACKLLRRNFIGVEIVPTHFKRAERRINSTEWGMFG